MGGGICPSCGTDVPTAARFRGECGTPVAARVCPSYGTVGDHRFCLECGTEIAAPATVDKRAGLDDLTIRTGAGPRPVAQTLR